METQPVFRNVPRSHAISLALLFQVTTCCSLFFACLVVSPVLAIGLTLVITPILIRTTLVLEGLRRSGRHLTILIRARAFLASVYHVAQLVLTGIAVSFLVCLVFGMFGFLFSLMVDSASLALESTLFAATAGFIWGIAGGVMVMIAIAIKTWAPLAQASSNQAGPSPAG